MGGAVRHFVGRHEMVAHADEVPVNQHDLAITLATFGYVNLRSMRRLGIGFTHKDVDAFIHMWRYVGWVQGIQEELLPDSFADQQEFFLASLLMTGDDFARSGPDLGKGFKRGADVLSQKSRRFVPTWAIEGTLFQ